MTESVVRPSLDVQRQEAQSFLRAAFGFKADDLHVVLWRLADKTSHAFTDLDEAARWGAGQADVYIHCAMSRQPVAAKTRLRAADADAIGMTWADVDIADAVHKRSGLPPDEATALALIRSTGLAPSLMLHSGHGLQGFWLLGAPLTFESEAERREAAVLVRAWDISLRERAKRAGYTLDAVGDLARLMRLPGTYNAKREPVVPVRLLEVA